LTITSMKLVFPAGVIRHFDGHDPDQVRHVRSPPNGRSQKSRARGPAFEINIPSL
jgi:hypothetical protein